MKIDVIYIAFRYLINRMLWCMTGREVFSEDARAAAVARVGMLREVDL